MFLFYFLAAISIFCVYDAVKTYLYTIKIMLGYKLAGCGPEIIEPYLLPLTKQSEETIWEDLHYGLISGVLAFLQYLNITDFKLVIDGYKVFVNFISLLL